MTKCDPERGAAAVEFAIILPILMMLLLGIVEFGYAFVLKASVSSAARVGVRNYAINWNDKVNGPTSKATAIDQAKFVLPNAGEVVTQVALSDCNAGIQTTMTIKYTYKSLTGMFDGMLGGGISLTERGSMQCGG